MIKPILEWLWIAKPNWRVDRKVSDLTKSEKLLLINLIQEEFDEMKKALMENDDEMVYDSAVDLIWVASNPIAALGKSSYDKYVDKIWRVEASNYSKFCETFLEAEITVESYREGSHPSKPGQSIEAVIRDAPPYYVVERSDGKILKSINYSEPEDFE